MFQLYLATLPNNLHENTTILANFTSYSKEDEHCPIQLSKENRTIVLPEVWDNP
jgi:hypothetical protein